MTHLPTSSQRLSLSHQVHAVFKNDLIQDLEVICTSGCMHKFYFSFFCFKSENGFGLSWLTPLFRVCSISILHSPKKYAYEVQTISPGNSFGVQGGTLAADSRRRRRQRRLEPESAMTVSLSRGKLRKYSLLFTLLLKRSCSCHPLLFWPDTGSVEA